MDRAQEEILESQQVGKDCLEWAVYYVSLGWPALCLCPWNHGGVREHAEECTSPGKRPIGDGGLWKRWQDEVPSEGQIHRWWERYITANVGMATGNLSGLVGVDVDGPEGEARLAELSKGDLPETLEFRRGPNRRLFYRIPEGATFRTTHEAAFSSAPLSFLAQGSQTVMPPSKHPSGDRYVWVEGRGPREIAAAPCPPWLVAHMTAPAQDRERLDLSDGETIPQGRRDTVLTSMAGTMRERGFSREAIEAALEIENIGRCDPPLPKPSIVKIARSTSRYPPDPYRFCEVLLNGAANHKNCLGTTSMFGLEPQPLHWLVPGYLPLGKLVLLAGDGGHGKSVLTLHLAACLSTGRMPFGLVGATNYEPVSTLLVSCEDDYEDTILPRLMTAGADLKRIFRVDCTYDANGKPVPFSLAHYQAIENELKQHPEIKLIVVDPAGAYVGRSGIDDHKDSELRALLGPLTELAARQGVTILIVKHLNKGATAKAVHKVGGSAGYVNAVRAAYLVAPDPDDENRKFFLPLKFNICMKPQALAFRFASLSPEEQAPILARCTRLSDAEKAQLGAQLFRMAWEGAVNAEADDVMAPRTRTEESIQKTDKAGEWLLQYLANGPKPSKELFAEATRNGLSRNSIFRAKKELDEQVRARKPDFHGDWIWELTVRDSSGQQNTSYTSGQMGHLGTTGPFPSVPKCPEVSHPSHCPEVSNTSDEPETLPFTTFDDCPPLAP